jgi:RNA polymerase sigma factor (sigma-70 family)
MLRVERSPRSTDRSKHVDETDDRRLLEQFVDQRDQAAFRALVTRYGPAVLRACRSLLHDSFEAEDAFQATFLVLVRRAPSIRDPDRLGNWLIGVANRVAARSRRDLDRRRKRQAHRAAMLTTELHHDNDGFDLRDVLREELDRLPAHYRLPLQLCYLEGLTHEEAAERLCWPVGTVKVRLVRSRRLLRERLERRGAALGILLLLVLPRSSRAELPPHLVDSTVDAMTRAATTRAATTGLKPTTPSGPIPLSQLFSSEFRRWALVALLGLTFLAAGVARRVESATLVKSEEIAAYPASMMDVLNVRCR